MQVPWEVLSETWERPPPMSETLMVGPLGGAVKDPGTLTTYVRDVDGRPPRRHCRRPKSAHHLCRRRRWWGPWEVLSEIRERPPPMSKTSMAFPLGGANVDPGALTTFLEDVDGSPPRSFNLRPWSEDVL
jgi:hypothetical protein